MQRDVDASAGFQAPNHEHPSEDETLHSSITGTGDAPRSDVKRYCTSSLDGESDPAHRLRAARLSVLRFALCRNWSLDCLLLDADSISHGSDTGAADFHKWSDLSDPDIFPNCEHACRLFVLGNSAPYLPPADVC